MPFVAVFQTEVRYNLKRIAPYALMVLFSANAVLWWGWGPAIARGWAVNSDFYIVWLFGGFSFMTMPLFIALMMGDPVTRDFRIGVDPLIFSKPVSRAEYLLGKFSGNFFVLVCCQACFALTPLLLQAVSTKGMIVLAPRVLPYFQHFFFFIVVSSLALAALFFAVGALTRNVRIVYGLAVSFYPLYIAWQFAMKGLPWRWRIALDPLLFNVGGDSWQGRSAEWLNQLTVSYDADMIANRILMVAASLACLAVVYVRFSIAKKDDEHVGRSGASILDFTPQAEKVCIAPGNTDSVQSTQALGVAAGKNIALPPVRLLTQGLHAGLAQFTAALSTEFRLLRAERSLMVIAPLVTLLCGLALATYRIIPEASYSATYAARTTDNLLLFLFGIAVFYTGETMHRDRELKIEPVLWSTPVPNFVLLLSKFSAILLLSVCLTTLVGLTAIVIQILKGHAPLEAQTYLVTYAVILLPSIVFMIAASVALNSLLRDKYLTYIVSLAIGGAVYYFADQGYHNWLYNPVLYKLWTPSDLIEGGSHLPRILVHRIYCFSLSTLLLALAHLFSERKTAKGLKAQKSLSGAGWAGIFAAASVITAVITGLVLSGGK
jgi:ABC-type transport system involved in multi-copper enzyme maturation permease subunit